MKHTMPRFNPTLTAMTKARKANRDGASKRKANQAAAQAVEAAAPPTNGDAYDYENRLVAKAKD